MLALRPLGACMSLPLLEGLVRLLEGISLHLGVRTAYTKYGWCLLLVNCLPLHATVLASLSGPLGFLAPTRSHRILDGW